jgi:hypothetical protein
MALRDLWRGGHREQHREQRTRFPMDPMSRDSWRDEAEARYGARQSHDYNLDDESRHFNDRWQNSYSGPGYGSFNERESRQGATEYGGSSSNPFYGDHPLTRAGSEYDSDYFGRNGLPTTPWRPEVSNEEFSDLVYGGNPERQIEQWQSSRSQGSSQQGQFRGHGPRGYRRSDDRIKEDVCQCLTDDEHIDASNIEVAVNDREVVLSGTVQSRAEKRHAEDLIERLPGVRDVINGLRVAAGAQGTSASSSGGWR